MGTQCADTLHTTCFSANKLNRRHKTLSQWNNKKKKSSYFPEFGCERVRERENNRSLRRAGLQRRLTGPTWQGRVDGQGTKPPCTSPPFQKQLLQISLFVLGRHSTKTSTVQHVPAPFLIHNILQKKVAAGSHYRIVWTQKVD